MAAVDWVTRTEVKNALGFGSGTDRDTAIDSAITAASRALNRRCSRELTPKVTSAAKTFRVPVRSRRDGVIVDLAPYEARAASVVRLNPEESSPQTLTANTDYALWPTGAVQPTNTYLAIKLASHLSLESAFADRFGYAQLEVTATWGAWDTAEVLEDAKRACIVTVGAWIDKAIAEYGRDFAGEDPRLMFPPSGGAYAIPLAALTLLEAGGLMRRMAV